MPFRILSRVLLRAPLLPVRAVGRGAGALLGHPLGRGALALASPELAAALDRGPPRAGAARAIERYARRAAFRPTPGGWLH
jgi:hypothetical protein